MTSNGMNHQISYESMLTYLENAEKQMLSTVDVNCFTNPFDKNHNYVTINDLQIYCDTLLHHLCEELSELSLYVCGSNESILETSLDNNTTDSSDSANNHYASISRSSPDSGSTSPLLMTNSATTESESRASLATSVPSVHSNHTHTSFPSPSNSSGDSIDHKPRVKPINNNYRISYQRMSFYENNDEIAAELLTASQIQKIIEKHKELNSNKKAVLCSKTRNNNSNSVLKSQSMSSLPSRTALFGCHIDSIQCFTGGLVLPPFIEKCLAFLSRKGISCVGIFRKSGVKSRIMSLKAQAEEGSNINFSEVCVYDIADITKTWLRELKPKQLLTQQVINSFKERKKDFTLCVLPDSQRAVLQVVLRFLALISNNSNINQMNSHNLAICLTPSLCECDGDQQLFDAQRCLEFCIDNCESLFVVSLNSYSIPNSNNSENAIAYKHESTAIVHCGPHDVLARILYQRNLIDPTIIEWNIVEEVSSNSDTILMKMQTSLFLPIKSIIVARHWRINDRNNIEIIENGFMFESRWSITSNGDGKTLVAHMIALDLRGHSFNWYSSTFPAIHNLQLYHLSQSFLLNKIHSSKETDI